MWKCLGGVALAVGLLSGCYFTDELQGDGNTVTESRVTTDFTTVENRGSLEVVVREGEVPDVKVTLDENLQHRVRTFVSEGDTLVIETDGAFAPQGAARVEVRVPRMVGATQDGSGSLRVEGFEHVKEDVKLLAKGSGSLSFCGGVRTLEAKLSGSGSMELCAAGEGLAEWVDLSQTGSGRLKWAGSAKQVRALTDGSGFTTLTGTANRLDAWLDGSGGIGASGLRAVDVRITSRGSGAVSSYVDGGGAVVTVDSSGSVDLYGHAQSTQVRVNGSGRVNWH
ncbi:GIN domain-containing protein [Corallococcus sp. RDP092CA]|uniref:GIN domain-containing protein n=1 Tax=Corallococcus sp. RDP092CA TaxID=3109369 RepID=UPI0035AF662F